MSIFSTPLVEARLTLRVLAHLLRYPDAELRAHIPELQQALQTEKALPATRLAELHALLQRLASQPALDSESEYVELFDRGRRTALLEFASSQPPQQAREFLGEIAHIVRVIFSALLKRDSPYASVLAAVLELAGEKAEAVAVAPEPEMDESWSEPEVFGGCSTEGQAKPGAPQPIQFVKKYPTPSLGDQA